MRMLNVFMLTVLIFQLEQNVGQNIMEVEGLTIQYHTIPYHLDVVHAPLGVCVGVLLIVAVASRNGVRASPLIACEQSRVSILRKSIS